MRKLKTTREPTQSATPIELDHRNIVKIFIVAVGSGSVNFISIFIYLEWE
jgi:hypothetical protein